MPSTIQPALWEPAHRRGCVLPSDHRGPRCVTGEHTTAAREIARITTREDTDR